MEFHEKLQELRKQKSLTQEELAEKLYVSRTAVYKWESGRGYPNIDSLKAIAKFFAVTVDQLISSEEVLTVAEADQQEKQSHFCDLVFGLLDCSMVLFFFLPIFGQQGDGAVLSVSLLALTGIQTYLRATYFAVVIGSVVLGIVTLALQNCGCRFWMRNKGKLSILLNAAGAFLFILSQQVYGAVYMLTFFIIKAWILLRQQ
jgi:transcriptional regulator with XRE-family HTH domain